MSRWWDEYKAKEQARLERLRQSILSGEVTETEAEDSVVCPWCGSDDSDDRYDGEGEHEYICGHCGKDYICSVRVSVRYYTSQKEAK